MTDHLTRTDNSASPQRRYAVLLPSSPHGARRARRLAVDQLRCWDVAFESAAYVVAELASNAVRHGRLAGRDFRLTLALLGGSPGATLRIEVSDARAECLPDTRPRTPGVDDESGRGLLLVDALADRWGAVAQPVPGKTVWAELDLAQAPPG
ncbi:ATP-binding protein [Streptomyces sp. Z26]|uniref:ATP-binding protein n=1 Tax=Streptomyces sp. Z26 TaxID=2500177 RepID=UPI000EF1462C|nr:ATP-binding protein [Streptomyces sp. Z26]RLL68429.1 ATP-binding protein [Streptomyces sp. Z26]